jgi:magnesium transporter
VIRAFLCDDQREFHGTPSREQILESVAASSGILWVDLDTADPAGRTLLEDGFRFHPLAIDDCYNGRLDTPKIDDYERYLFIQAQSIDYSVRSGRLNLTEIGLFLGPTYVVTVRDHAVDAVDHLARRAEEDPHFMSRGADFLAHMILDAMVDEILPAVEDMDEELDELEAAILRNPDRQLLQQVLLLKRNSLRLRRSVLPQRDLVNRLSRGEFPELIRQDAQIFYRDIYDHIVRVESMLEGLRDLADSALSSYLSAVNNRMNEIMKALSVVAVIFLPLTLVASIFGTNLDYSPFGLTFRSGFFAMLAFMAVIAAAMVAYFRVRGWF